MKDIVCMLQNYATYRVRQKTMDKNKKHMIENIIDTCWNAQGEGFRPFVHYDGKTNTEYLDSYEDELEEVAGLHDAIYTYVKM